LVRLKFELTNRDSEVGKSFIVLTSMSVNRTGIAVGQRFLLAMAFNIHEKELMISKTV